MSHDAPRTKAVAELGRATTSEDDSGDGFQVSTCQRCQSSFGSFVSINGRSVAAACACVCRHHTGGISQACEYGSRPFPLTQVAVACPSSFKSRVRIRTHIHRLDETISHFTIVICPPPPFLFFRLAFVLVAAAITAFMSRNSAYHFQSAFPMADFWGALIRRVLSR
ncbi:hypothetical protein H4582DRAFT_762493 [Lactarius indigo]|nr:hypothetical protein H4582DRAFT_762493 [Lactarius indigo]